MDALAMYDTALQAAAAFLIFIVGYLALLLFLLLCLLAAEALRQGAILARTSYSKSVAIHGGLSAAIAATVSWSSVAWGWMHRLAEGLAGNLKLR